MRRYRFFISSPVDKDKFFIKDKEFHHLKNVLRLKQGDIVYGITEDFKQYVGKIEKIEDDKAICKYDVLGLRTQDPGLRTLSVMQSIIKEKKMSLIMEKAPELNVDTVIPLISKRSSWPLNTDKNKKILRWQNIIESGIKQCGNLCPTRVEDILDIKNIDKFDFSKYDEILLLSPLCRESGITVSRRHGVTNLLVIIGPEGGFTEEEEELFVSKGARPILCSNNILRSETAFFYIASVLDYLLLK